MKKRKSFKNNNLNKFLIAIVILIILLVLFLIFKFKSPSTGNAILMGKISVSDSCLGMRSYGVDEKTLASCYQKVKNKDITSFSEAEELGCADYVCGAYKLTQDSRLSAKDKNLANRNCLNFRLKNLKSYCSDWCYSGIKAENFGEYECNKIETANPNLKSPKVCRDVMNVGVNLEVIEKCSKIFESPSFLKFNSFAKVESIGCGEYACGLYWLSTHRYKGINSSDIYRDSCIKSIGNNGKEFIDILSKTRCAEWKTEDKELFYAKQYGTNREMLSTLYPLLENGNNNWMYRIENYSVRGSWEFSDRNSSLNDTRFNRTFQGFEYNSNPKFMKDTAIYQPMIFNKSNYLNINYNGFGSIDIDFIDFYEKSMMRISTICENEKKGSTTISKIENERVTQVIFNSGIGNINSLCNSNSLGFNKDNQIIILPREGAIDITLPDFKTLQNKNTFTILNPAITEDEYYHNLKFTITPQKNKKLSVSVWGLNADK